MGRNAIRFLRNGVPTQLDKVGANETLLDYLRLRERTCGTKEGCGEGDCGACTVAIGSLKNGQLVYEPVNACIQLLGQIDGKDIITIDDLATGNKLHPIQSQMVEFHASQCGFCTPGIIMSLFSLYHSGEKSSRENINNWLSGNLCRCTGYRPIAQAAAKAIDGRPDDFLTQRLPQTLTRLEELNDKQDVFVGSEERFFAAPASIDALAALCAKHPDATILSGATDVALWITKQLRDLPKIIFTGRATGFADIHDEKNQVRIGAGVTYEDAFKVLNAIDPDIGEVIRRLGSKPVRTSGTVGGNIANGSPIGDMPPMLIALDARLELRHGDKTRQMALEDFFIAYGKQDRAPGELVTALTVPRLKPAQHFRAYKISKRFDQDISSVMAAFRIEVENEKIITTRIAFGGMAATPKRAAETELALVGSSLSDEALIATALEALAKDFTPLSDMRASADYRLKVSQNLLKKAL
ncbi:MAG: xanthine dehydrogenase small subunit, partial [Rhizobiaceae bacterium]|nr:xanthine dehydrogenase small subunit [Rhizobiaceae bacterium]